MLHREAIKSKLIKFKKLILVEQIEIRTVERGEGKDMFRNGLESQWGGKKEGGCFQLVHVKKEWINSPKRSYVAKQIKWCIKYRIKGRIQMEADREKQENHLRGFWKQKIRTEWGLVFLLKELLFRNPFFKQAKATIWSNFCLFSCVISTETYGILCLEKIKNWSESSMKPLEMFWIYKTETGIVCSLVSQGKGKKTSKNFIDILK